MLSPENNKTNTWTLYASHKVKNKNNNVNSERIKHIKEPIHVGKQTTLLCLQLLTLVYCKKHNTTSTIQAKSSASRQTPYA